MISFDKINEFDRLYHVWNHYFRWAHNKLYYKQIQIIGYENLPPKGYPVFVISNHLNALMDPLAILYLFKDKRQPVFIARGDIFKKSDFIAKILRFLKILPTFRSRDGSRSDVRSNELTFDLAARILNEKGTLMMFPEAGHQQGRYFVSFKKGFPRIAFRAAEVSDYKLDFRIVPMYIYYTEQHHCGEKQVVVIGEPFSIEEFYELYKTEPNRAFLQMNEKARERVRALGIDVTDHDHYSQYDTLMTVCRSKEIALQKLPEKEPYSALQADKKTVARVDSVKENQPETFAELMDLATEYRAGLEKLRLRDWLFDQPAIAFKTLILKILLYVIGFPFYLFGLINNFIPFKSPNPITRKLKDQAFASTINFALPVILVFPLWYLILFIVVLCLANWWIAILYVAATFACLFLYFRYKKSFIKFCGQWRYRCYQKKGNAAFLRLQELRQRIRGIVFPIEGEGA